MAKLPKNLMETPKRESWTVNRVNGAGVYPYSVLWECDGASGTVFYRTKEMAQLFIAEMQGENLDRIRMAVDMSSKLYPYIVRTAESGDVADRCMTYADAKRIVEKYNAEDGDGLWEVAKLNSVYFSTLSANYMTYTENKIRSARINAGLSQQQLADMSGSSARTIQDWESCRRIPRDVYVLRDVAKALGCHIEDLID